MKNPWNLGFCVPTITPLVKLNDAVEKIFVLNYFWDTKTTRVNVGIKHEQLHRRKLRYLPLPHVPPLTVVYLALLLQMAYVDRVVMKQLSQLPLFASQMSDGEMYIQSLMIEWWKFKAEETGQLTLFSALRKKAKVKTPQLQEVDSKLNKNLEALNTCWNISLWILRKYSILVSLYFKFCFFPSDICASCQIASLWNCC